ncbi:hypothetical protein OG455_33000 [Kitasatospora sp. NBC_01287]|uniref:DUF6879 family protein n=1 Tax=Kitasatospora sp. NBC_01287 TaxID=2903573 RepID=UPI00225960D8|nr:DUF6879 family protein [Kitasatospora sp. NBC_01287]MCX4750278.1 hypothetical protein [Kitasatospora sp. NBC_01287]
MASEKTFEQLFRAAEQSAVHLEMRDGYMLDDPSFIAWQQDGRLVLDDEESRWWRRLVRDAVARGVEVRRARIVSEPLSAYTRFEYDSTSDHNAAAGEQVRWLPRRQATDLALPGNDFWLFDATILLANHFTGNGEWVDTQTITDPVVVKHCAAAFLSVWERAVPHEDYRPAE